MIIYQADKSTFLEDVFEHDIEAVIAEAFARATGGKHVGAAEITSWKNSLMSMGKVLRSADIPDTCGVAIEYNIPQTAKRVDFILTGQGATFQDYAIIVELKQWTSVSLTDKDAVVTTFLGGGPREVSHPSYQAWSYAALLQGFNESVYSGNIDLRPCAYLHNYTADDIITHEFYREHIDRAPLFFTGDEGRDRLRSFIATHLRYGDTTKIIERIEGGNIRPSKNLADSLASLLKGNREFILIDDQKVVYETALSLVRKAQKGCKQVLIVEGGPGTGKSVVAVNLLVAITDMQLFAKYVSKNAAPRAVFESKLTGSFKKSEISNLFTGSGAFTETEGNAFGALIVDEAHRLNKMSGLYANLGENQIKEIIGSAHCTVFFVDESQMVTFRDIGEIAEIKRWAQYHEAHVTTMSLASQFRCNGSDGYIAWLDDILGIRETANTTLDADAFDFRVVDSPRELHDLIIERNKAANKARVVAGYCWNWQSKNNQASHDIVFDEFNYAAKWNLSTDGSLWILKPESVKEVGCIHTCQGLEVDYVGVIVGPDFVVRDGAALTDPKKRARTDQSLKGLGILSKKDPEAAKKKADLIIKNTYRTLMTRGMKGCYVYFADPQTAAFFRSRIGNSTPPEPLRMPPAPAPRPAEGEFPFVRVPQNTVKPFVNAVPLIHLKMAAGAFSALQNYDPAEMDWVRLPDDFNHAEGTFVAQVLGESMNRRIPNGAWCIFKAFPQGTRQGKIVIARHRSIADPDCGACYTVKQYSSEKQVEPDGQWRHTKVTLSPMSGEDGFSDIVFEEGSAGEVEIVAEFVASVW